MDTSPLMGEIGIAAFNFPPKGWAMCDGQFLQINQNQALFALLGTGFGGNGQTTFALPDLRGRVPMHAGNGHGLYERGGEELHTVILSELPLHFHFVNASATQANSPFVQVASPASQNVFATVAGGIYGPLANLTAVSPDSLSSVGGSQSHENRQPFLVLNFCIALQGIFPSRD